MKKITFLLTLLVLTGSSIKAQTANEIFEKYINSKKAEKEYQMNISYSLYKGKEGQKVYENYEGIQAKQNDAMYQKLSSTELILGVDFMVKLNTTEKAMLVGYSSKPIFNKEDMLDNAKILEVFKKKEMKDLGTHYKLVLSEPQNAVLSDFSSIELHIDKERFTLSKQIFHYALASDFSIYSKEKNEPEYDNPRLEIDFSDYTFVIDIPKDVFNKDRYFKYKDNKITASNTYKGFEIIYAN